MQENANNPLIQGFQLGKKIFLTGNIFFSSWALFSAQLGVFTSIVVKNLTTEWLFCKRFSTERRWAVNDERWTVNDERWVGTLRAASEVFYSRKSRKSRQGLEQYFVIRSIGYAIRWNWGRDLQSPSMLSGHRPLYSKTANNIFAVTERHVFPFWFLCSSI